MKKLMKKMNERKGFTLAELLIVVAIIAVLVAVAIPVFTAQLNKARLATATANARSEYAAFAASYLTADSPTALTDATVTGWAGKLGVSGATVSLNGTNIVVTYSGSTNSFAIDSNILATPAP